MVSGGEGAGPGGGLPPPVDKTTPTHTSGAFIEWESLGGGPPVDRRGEIGPASKPERPRAFPGSDNPGDGNRAERRVLPPSPLSKRGGGEGGERGRLERPRTAMGPAIAVPSGGGRCGGRGY